MKLLFMKYLFLSLLMFVAGNVGAETKWVKTDPADLEEGDVVVIYDMYDGYAMKNDGGTSTPGALKVTLSTDKTQLKYAPATNIQWTVKRSGDTYQFYATDDTWLYCLTNNNNGLRVGTSSYKNFNIQVVNDRQWLYNINQSRYVVLNNAGETIDWRSYTNTTGSAYRNTQIAFFKKETDDYDVNISISAVGYATLYYSDRALKVPMGVTAKTYKVTEGKLAESKTYAAGKVIPEGEAVVLKGSSGSYTFKASTTTEQKDGDNMLKGSDEEKTTTGGNYYYALRAKAKDGTGGPGFYWMDSTGSAFTNGAHKVYMALEEKFAEDEEEGSAKSFFLFEEATGISDVKADGTIIKSQHFNMSGQHAGSNYKGIVSVNGQKFLVK